MRTNIEIDDVLMDSAMRMTGVKTKREAIDIALKTLVRIRQQDGIRELWGIGWEGDLNEMRTDKPRPLIG